MAKIVIDPLMVEVVTAEGEVKEARCSGTLFPASEVILQGRDRRDAQRLMQPHRHSRWTKFLVSPIRFRLKVACRFDCQSNLHTIACAVRLTYLVIECSPRRSLFLLAASRT